MKNRLTFIPHSLRMTLLTLLTILASVPMWGETPDAKNNVDYLCFTAEEDGSTIAFKQGQRSQRTTGPGFGSVKTSTDGMTWADYTLGTVITLRNAGDKVYFKGNYHANECNNEYSQFSMTGKIAASGNIMTLTDEDSPTTSLEGKNYAFLWLFDNCASLTTAPELPATTLAKKCYCCMFDSCTSLTKAPELPATILAENCYTDMFNGCASLTKAPELPATTLAKNCYVGMFERCASLTEVPKLPATTLADGCYAFMFEGCKSLTKAPELPATKLAEGCYSYMFDGCTSLTKAPELPATKLAEGCYKAMFMYCTSLTKAPELPATKLAKESYYCMFDSCASLTKAPELPATKLVESCYDSMFQHCKKLNYIKVSFTEWNSDLECTSAWVYKVADTGTFVCPKGLAKEEGAYYIPDDWTVKTF